MMKLPSLFEIQGKAFMIDTDGGKVSFIPSAKSKVNVSTIKTSYRNSIDPGALPYTAAPDK